MGKKIGGYIMLVIGIILGLGLLATLPTIFKGGGGELAYNIGYLIGQLIGLALVTALAAFLIMKGLKFIK
jgi:hypothetical protein